MRSARALNLLAGVPLLLLISACGNDSASDSANGGAPLAIVASTNVYADIVSRIAGDAATVTSIISDPEADPHSYEANAQNQLALSKADIVIENGGGYDDFVDTMLGAVNNPHATVINVVELSGYASGSGELNEHVWYDFPTVAKLVDRLTSELVAKDTGQAATFSANASSFKQKLTDLQGRAAAVKARYAGEGVAITEPVPLYLLQACGLENRTPAEFSEAVETGTDVGPAVLQQTLNLFSSGQVALLAYNEQTAGPETEKVRHAATDANIPVVPFRETLPAGKDYLTWMSDNINNIDGALG